LCFVFWLGNKLVGGDKGKNPRGHGEVAVFCRWCRQRTTSPRKRVKGTIRNKKTLRRKTGKRTWPGKESTRQKMQRECVKKKKPPFPKSESATAPSSPPKPPRTPQPQTRPPPRKKPCDDLSFPWGMNSSIRTKGRLNGIASGNEKNVVSEGETFGQGVGNSSENDGYVIVLVNRPII